MDAENVLALVIIAFAIGTHIGWDSRARSCRRKHPDVFWYRDRALRAERRCGELVGERDEALWQLSQKTVA